MPQRHHEATHSSNYALGKTPGCEKHVRTARGRVLAEGDLNPAAGSRDEPTRLPVEDPVAERKLAFEVQVHKVFVLEVKYKGCRLWRRPFTETPGMHTAALIFRARTRGRPKNENKRPQPQSDPAGPVQTLFATFSKT